MIGDMTQITRAASAIPSAVPIVGRQQELASIMHSYEAMIGGVASVVLVTGEPGIGKSRLLDEIAGRVSRGGATVLRGGSSQAEGMPPYLPFLEALGHYIQHAPAEELQMQDAATLQALASQFPELTTRLGTLPTSAASLPEQARFRLYEAVGTFLQHLGASHPLVLILDDLHWTDSASLDLLSHVMRRHHHARLLVLGAYRNSEINQHAALVRSIAELSRQRLLTTITLGPLSAPEIATLAEHILAGPLREDASVRLYAHSEGNPFFAEELLQSWVERKSLMQCQGQWIPGTPLDEVVPPGIIGVLRQRFSQLSPDCIDHLRVAAIIGQSFDLFLLAQVKTSRPERVEHCLFEAIQARLVRAEPGGSFIFSHDYIRVCLYAEVSLARRRMLHAQIGAELESLVDQDRPLSTQQLAQLAFHFARSEHAARGIAYAARSGAQALQDGAAAEAVHQYRVALSLLDDPADPRRSTVLLQLSQAQLLASHTEKAGAVTTGEDPRLQLAHLLLEQADRAVEQGNVAQANDLLKQALALFEALGMAAGTQQVRNRLQRLARGSEMPVSFPHKLTPRQVTILRLVTQGKSNRQIAHALGLTEKTVTNHLTHIFNRTNCENRTALTAFALRHDFV